MGEGGEEKTLGNTEYTAERLSNSSEPYYNLLCPWSCRVVLCSVMYACLLTYIRELHEFPGRLDVTAM